MLERCAITPSTITLSALVAKGFLKCDEYIPSVGRSNLAPLNTMVRAKITRYDGASYLVH